MRHSRKLYRVRSRCLAREDNPILAALFSCAADMSAGARLHPVESHHAVPTRPLPSTPRQCPGRLACSQSAIIRGSAAGGALFRLQLAVRQDYGGTAEPMLHSGTASAAHPLQTVRPPPGCQAPLFERPAQHVVAADALRAWRQSAITAIEAVGDAHAAQDGGSTAGELKARPRLRATILQLHVAC